jgi:hypothetical protein
MRRASELEAALPDGELGGETAGETAFDELDGALEGDFVWGEEEVDVVGHDDEGVQFVMAFFTPPGKERPSGAPIRGGSVGGFR